MMRQPTRTQIELLRSLANMVSHHTGEPYRVVPFLLSTELDGTQGRSARGLERLGLAEWRDGVEDNGDTVFALWLTEAGRKFLTENPND